MEENAPKTLRPMGRGGKIALIVFGSLSALSACLWLGVSVASHGESGYLLLLTISLFVSAVLWGVFLFRRKERSARAISIAGVVFSVLALVLSVGGVAGSAIALNIRGAHATMLFYASLFTALAGVIMGIVAACSSKGKRAQLAVGLVAALLPLVSVLAVIGLFFVGAPVIRFM